MKICRPNFLSLAVLWVTLPVLVIIFCSCSQPRITVGDIKSYKEISEGEKATISWNFENADEVRVSGIDSSFSSYDSIEVEPAQSTKYDITAYQGDEDSLVQTVRVIVNKKEEKEIRRGPEVLKQVALTASNKESAFFRGITNCEGTEKPVQLKIMNCRYNPESDVSCRIRALILDKFGNNLKGLKKFPNAITWSADNECEAIKLHYVIPGFKEEQNSLNSKNIDIALLLDNSSLSRNDSALSDNLSDFISSLSRDDNILFSTFNQRYNLVFPLTEPEKALRNIENTKLPQPGGINALYKAASIALNQVSTGINISKLLIIITYNSDIASVNTSVNDVTKDALRYDIPVYVLSIGNATQSYFLKYICSASGGRFYNIQINETGLVPDILREIAFSQKFYYETELPAPFRDKSCEKVKSEIVFEFKKSKLRDKIELYNVPPLLYVPNQTAALFNYKDPALLSEYDDIASSIAGILKGNPESHIELIGHSGREDSENFNMEISLERAESVKSRLIELGAKDAQISTRPAGASKPLFLTDAPQNRRVEVRWLLPSLLPYEIVAERAISEEDAVKKTEAWEKRGFKAYFDRYMQNNSPLYKVKLWGYATRNSAEEVAGELSKKYRQFFEVE